MHLLFLSSMLTLSHVGPYPPLPESPVASSTGSYVVRSNRTWNWNMCSRPQILEEIQFSSAIFRKELISKIAEGSAQLDFVMSPLSVAFNLFVVNSGIRRDEGFNSFANAFGLPESNCFRKLGMQIFVDHLKNYEDTGLSMASSVFASSKMLLRPRFLETITTTLRSPIRYIDFENARERQDFISKWGSDETKDVVDSSTSLAIVNIVYFKGEWLESFDVAMSEVQFFTNNRRYKSVPIMRTTGHFRHGIHPKANAFFYELPFLTYDDALNMSMFCIRPNWVETKESTVDFWNKIKDFTIEELMLIGKYGNISVELPRFSIASKIDVKSVVERAARDSRIFDPSTSKSYGITVSPNLFVDKFEQNVEIIVNEDGIEAKAMDILADPSPPDSFHSGNLDRPFFIMVCTMGKNPQIAFSALYNI